jgi:hypothetical protein
MTYYEDNREARLAYAKTRYAANRDRLNALARAYRQANSERVNELGRRSHNNRVNNPKVFNGEPVSTTELTYVGAHRRVQVNRGRASLYECVCGKNAEQWAWTHAENEYTREGVTQNFQGEKVLSKYSLNVWDYLALCRSCHTRLDKFGYILHDHEVAA